MQYMCVLISSTHVETVGMQAVYYVCCFSACFAHTLCNIGKYVSKYLG